ncbi:MAG: hypothetical protein GWP05_02885 [Anaerolineaceae bacterium]|nr:hypothetical protein [Anaerolineaceae bacterium]
MKDAPEVRILLGPARSQKALTVRRLYLELLGRCDPSRILLLVPTSRRRQATLNALLRESGRGVLCRAEVWTFPRFAEHVLGLLGRPVRRVTPLQQRGLLADALAWCRKQKKITYFGPVIERPGLLDSLSEFIRKLKTEEIRPEDFAGAVKARRGPLADLAALYVRYQMRLTDHNLYDDAGLFWQTREALAAAGDSFSWPAHVLVDGFQNFARPQRDVLRILHRRGAAMVITLPCRKDRPEVFAPTLQTLKELQETFAGEVRIEEHGRAAGGISTLAHLERFLFEDRAGPPEKIDPGHPAAVTFTETAGRTREVEHLARRIKQLLQADRSLRPAEVAVVLRSRELYEGLIAEIFPRYGLPLDGLEGTPLHRLPLPRWLLEVVSLPVGNFNYRDLTAVLRSPYFPREDSDADRQTVEAADRLLHQSGVFEGADNHLQAIRRYIADRRDNGRLDRQEDQEAAKAEAATAGKVERLLERFFDRLEAIPQDAPRMTFVAAMLDLLDDFDLDHKVTEVDDPALMRRDMASLESLRDLLGELEELDEVAPAAAMTLREFVTELQAALESAKVAPPRCLGGGVNILDVHSSRALSFPVVAVPGLLDGCWPQPYRTHLVETPENLPAMAAAGLAVPDRRAGMAEERFLFYMTVTRATDRLILTRPASDEDGRPLAPSPFWDELLRVTVGRDRSTVETVTARDCDLPVADAANPEELRRVVMLAVAEDKSECLPLLAAVDRLDPTLRATLHSVAVEKERESAQPFGRFDGVLSDEALLKEFADRYPARHVFSITSLENYARCPFLFFAQTVCRLEPWRLAEQYVLEDQVGLLYHDILSDFYLARRKDGPDGTRLELLPVEPLLEEMSASADRVFSRRENLGGKAPGGLPAMWEIQKDEIRQRLLNYVRRETTRCRDLPFDVEPRLFEWSFGMTVHKGADPQSTTSPAAIDSDDGPIHIRGRIDRIDLVIEDGRPSRLIVIDYKSGAKPTDIARRVREGLALQLPLYLLAVEQTLGEQMNLGLGQGAYYYLRDLDYYAALSLIGRRAEAAEALLDSARARVAEMVGRCRRGEFPPAPAAKCPAWCPYHGLCRTARWRVEYKTVEETR